MTLAVVVLALVFGTMIATAGTSLLGVGLILASGVGVAGTVDTETATAASGELLLTDISKVISQIRPDDTPLDTMLREIGAGDKAEAWKFEFYENTTRSIGDLVKTAFTAGAAGAKDLEVGNVTNWNVDDVIYVPSIFAVGSSGPKLRMQVIDKNISANTIQVIALNGTVSGNLTIVPSIADESPIYCIGNAKDETAAQTAAYQMLPGKTYNYAQVHMAQVEESVYQALHLKEVPYGLLEFKADSIYDLKMKADLASLLGTRQHRYDPKTGKMKYFSGGLIEFAGKSLDYSKASTATNLLSGNKFIDWAESMFADNNGSSKRVLLAGSKLIAGLMKVPTIQKQVEAKNTEIIFGVKYNIIDTAFGQIGIKMHKGLNLVGHEYDGFILDPTKIRRRELLPMSWKELKLEDAGISKVKAWKLEDTFGCEFRNPGTHAFITANA